MVKKRSTYKKSIFGLFFWLILNISPFAQSNQVAFNTIPKSGTILVNAHMDDDMIWMLPFWNISEKFIGGAMPTTPNYNSIIHDQQTLLNSGYNINYEPNWITPWGEISNYEYSTYYWGNNSAYSYLANDHLTAFWDNTDNTITRIETNKIKAKLEQYIASPSVTRIITHNNWGEYGHQHHKAINVAVRELAVKYRKDVWMLGCDNGSFIDVNVPSSITYTMGSFNTPDLFTGIRTIYQNYGRWTWLADFVPSGNHKFIKIVDGGVDKSNILTGQTVTYAGPSQDEPGAYIFNGIDDYMTLPGNNNATYSIAMRVRPGQILKMDISKMAEYPLSSNFDRSLNMLSDGRITATVLNSASHNVTVTSTSRMVAGNWSHILMTNDGNWLKLYINGIIEDSTRTSTSPMIFDSPEFVLGQAQATSNFYNGQINEVQFYDHALLTSEINSLFGTAQPSTYTITASDGTGGTINPSGKAVVNKGDTQAYTISPDNGYFINDVNVDNSSVGPVSNYTFTNVKANHTIVAEFLPLVNLNLALNKPSASESNEISYVASKANDADGTNNSYWSAAPYPQWWMVDLGNFYDLSSIVIRNYVDNNRYYKYEIEASLDNIVYTSVASKSNTRKATDAGDLYTVAATARYLRVNMTYNSANSGVHISDFRVYGTLNNSTFYNISGSAGTGGIIDPEGNVKKIEGSNQTFDVTPNDGYQISDVKADNISVGAVSTHTFNNISANHTISASFTPITFTITGTAGNGGTINPAGIVTVNYGTNQSYSITANTGYQISDVKVDNVSVGAVTNYQFNNVRANHSIIATFTPITYTITGNAGTGGTLNPAGIVTVNYGTSQSYAITANTGYQISDVKVDNVSVGAVSAYIFNNVKANHSILATFTPITYTITANAGTGGTINPAGMVTVNSGTSQSYTITANTGYQISDVKIDNVSVGAVSAYIFNNVKANHSISATFTPITYTITANAGTGGTINPAGIVTVNYGTSQSYSITANTGYQISDVKIDNASVGIVSSYVFNNIRANHSVSATFTPVTYNITGTAGTGGTINQDGNVTVNYGTSQSFSITANTGYQISDVKIDNASVGIVSSYVFNNIKANHLISATFAPVFYTITGIAGDGGIINPAGVVTLIQGKSQTYNISPDDGFMITDLKVDDVSLGSLSSYVFNTVTTNHTISVKFMPITYIITQNAGTGGKISSTGTDMVYKGAQKTYFITADTGYQISDVKVDSISVGAISTYIFDNITENHTISASFSEIINTYKISANAETGGSIYPAGTIELTQGLAQTYNITANRRSQISDVQIDNVSMGILSSYTFNNINTDHTISVSFLPKEVREIADYSDIDITVYPNPFKEEFTIRIDDPVKEIFNLSIMSSSGKQIYYRTKLSSKDVIVFNEPLMPGVYYLELFNREKRIIRLVVKN